MHQSAKRHPCMFPNTSIWSLCLGHIIALIILVKISFAYNQNPKLYIEVNCIKFIDPLLHGFQIFLPEEFVAQHLDPDKLPLVYATAVPLKQDAPSVRQLIYKEDIIDGHKIRIADLAEKTWYYLCIEFENMHRRHRQGNTSTSCVLKRTLDEFGKSADSTVSDITLASIWDSGMEFFVEVDSDFPLFIEFYLEKGNTPLQKYYISQPKGVRIRFDHLQPMFFYGSLCVVERPLQHSYTAMGRTVSTVSEHCYLDSLKTTAPRVVIQESLPPSAVRQKRNASSTQTSSLVCNVAFTYILLALVACCL